MLSLLHSLLFVYHSIVYFQSSTRSHRLLALTTFVSALALHSQVYGPLHDPSPGEKALQEFDQGEAGCLGSVRSTRIELGEYLSKPPPEQLVSAPGWAFRPPETGHGDPGLIGFGNSSSPAIASFNLSCTGQRRSLDIEYLLSYKNMGAVEVKVDAYDTDEPSPGASVIIDGLWGSPHSIPWFSTAPVPLGSKWMQVTITILSAEEEKVNGSLLWDNGNDEGTGARGDRKFKLLSMQCC